MQNIIVECLSRPGTALVYVSMPDMFGVINEIHLSSGHSAREVMHHKAKEVYANVTRQFCRYSQICARIAS